MIFIMNRHEQALLKAQSTVEKNKKFVKRYAKKRQWYHCMPECGWMNDPNGLRYYNHTTIVKKAAYFQEVQ
mgnify:CR=1 FL=1